MKGEFIPRGEQPVKTIGTAVAPELPPFVQVRARAQGYVGWLVNPGDVFMVPRHLYSPEWMDLTDEALILKRELTYESSSDKARLLQSGASGAGRGVRALDERRRLNADSDEAHRDPRQGRQGHG